MKLIDRLYGNVESKGHVCLGLDTDAAYLPRDYMRRFDSELEAVLSFNREIIDATLDITAVYKVQIAYYEAMGLGGLRVYAETLAYLRDRGAVTIADVKRGDIAKTAEMYAKAHFSGDFEADFITVNPFMGMDTLQPFLPWVKEQNKGLFVLVATSNPGAADIEGMAAADGETVSEKLGDRLRNLGLGYIGDCGYSAIGAVVGCTNPEQTRSIRARLASTFFLIPGYGAQGGRAEDLGHYLRDGSGGVVNSSRGILLAHDKPEFKGMHFAEAARAETLRMRDDILRAVK